MYQLADPPIAPCNDQSGVYVPLDQVPRSDFSRAGQMQVHVLTIDDCFLHTSDSYPNPQLGFPSTMAS